MSRKSKSVAPGTFNCFHDLPPVVERRMTPLEPDAQTMKSRFPFVETCLTLIPRRLVSSPLVCTDHRWASTLEQKTRTIKAMRTAGL